uniref:Uncharacterized protein n=1 Tax=Lygus hesperus TaxID=30085 RepID=A0A146LQN9_LYGHE
MMPTIKKFTSVDPHDLRRNITRFRFFEDMVDRSLDIFLVTPLLHFSLNEMFLNRASHEFTRYLQKKFRGVEGALILLSKPPRLPCVTVQVVENGNLVFCAHMLSLSVLADEPHTALPLMCRIINKKVALGKSVISFLGKKFRCAINSCELSYVQFQWLMGIAINETLKRDMNDGITIAHAMNGRQAHVFCTLEADDLVALWYECLRCGQSSLVDLDWKSVDSLFLAVNDHFLNTFGWNNFNMPVERMVVRGVSIARLKTLRMNITGSDLLFVLLKFVDMTCIESNPLYNCSQMDDDC